MVRRLNSYLEERGQSNNHSNEQQQNQRHSNMFRNTNRIESGGNGRNNGIGATTTTTSTSTTSHGLQRVWVKKSILDPYVVVEDQDDGTSSVHSSTSSNRIHRKDPNDSKDWDWVMGYYDENGMVRIDSDDNDSGSSKYVGLNVRLEGHEVCLADESCSQFEQGGEATPPSDLIALTHLHEPSVVYSLQKRYELSLVYTNTGSNILLALNPFQPLPDLYNRETMQQYMNHNNGSTSQRDPHVFGIADQAFRNMSITGNQSILVSGESGAGKTVTTKIAMRYLATVSSRRNKSLEQSVLNSNPILESFGNARTIRNDNSSRFGKFIQIQFHNNSNELAGTSIQTYLLEKVRLIRPTEGERNYHIFYELLANNNTTTTTTTKTKQYKQPKEWGLLGRTLQDFAMTSASPTTTRRDGVLDSDTYQDLRQAMTTVGFPTEQQLQILSVPCALLHMSNLTFVEKNTNDASQLDTTHPSLPYVLKLFGVSQQALNDALTTTTIQVGRELVYKHLTIEQAYKAVEALMKGTYGALFDYIVQKVNTSITTHNNTTNNNTTFTNTTTNNDGAGNDCCCIGVLDIFGFETFPCNSFEQLCINYCNEALQQQFNKFVFKAEQQEYQREGIEWNFIKFPDNQDVLDLMERKNALGIFSILDEQCRLAKCTDQSFAAATYQTCATHQRFSTDRRQKAQGYFTIHHYAGPVEYDTAGFLDKNKDELPKEATDLLLSSSQSLLPILGQILNNTQNTTKNSNNNNKRDMLQNKSSSKKSLLSRASVGSQFAKQLKELREMIQQTQPHYIRCLKPNNELIPHHFVPGMIADQLRCAGVLEAVRVSRVGYPQRYLHTHFVQRYQLLLWQTQSQTQPKQHHLLLNNTNSNNNQYYRNITTKKRRQPPTPPLCDDLVDAIIPFIRQRQKDIGEYDETIRNNKKFYPRNPQSSLKRDHAAVGIQMGNTKVFLRQKAFDALEYLRGQKLIAAATKVQSVGRMFPRKCQYQNTLWSTLQIQLFFRKVLALRKCQQVRRIQAAIVLQKTWRGFVCYNYLSELIYLAVECQRLFRGRKVRRQLAIQSCRKRLALQLQLLFRAKQARAIFRELRAESKNCNLLQQQKESLQLEVKRLQNELTSSQNHINSLEETLHELEEKLSNSEKCAMDDTSSNQSEQELTNNNNIEIEKLTEDCLAKDVEIEKFNKDCILKDEEIQTWKEGCALKDEEIQTWKEDCALKDKEIQTWKEDCALKDDEIKILTGICSKKDEEIEKLKEKLSTVEKNSFMSTTNNDISFEPLMKTTRIGYHPQSTLPEDSILPEDDSIVDSSFFSAAGTDYYYSSFRDRRKNMNNNSNHNISNDSISINSRMSGTSSRYIGNVQSQLSVTSLLDQQVNSLKKTHDNDCSNETSPTTTAETFCSGSFDNNANETTTITTTDIHSAILASDEDALAQAITNEEDVNRGDTTGKTPLHLAVLNSNVSSISYLLTNNSVVANTQDHNGNTPLHCAEDHEIVRMLLEDGGANPNIPNEAGICAIHLAVSRGDYKSLKLLLDHKASVNVADDELWRTPLHLIALQQQHSVSKNSSRDNIIFPIDEMSTVGKMAQLLCQCDKSSSNNRRPDLNYQDKDGNTPLHFAAMLDNNDAADLVSLFLKHGADPNIFNRREQTPLHLLSHNNSLRQFNFFHDVLHLFLHHGADPNLSSLSGCTALHLSLYHQDIESALQLVAGGAQLHMPWNKPERWAVFWQEIKSSSTPGSGGEVASYVVCMDMLEDKDDLHRILSALSCDQKWARSRPNCMQCKKKFGRFSRQHHCRHCGSLVCSKCSPTTLDPSYFPAFCKNHVDTGRVCKYCERILVSRKQEESLMGKNVYAIHGEQEDVSFLESAEISFLNDSMNNNNKSTNLQNDF